MLTRDSGKAFALGLALAATSFGATAQQSIMVTGDSIFAGFERPSFRQPLLDALSAASCTVDMVGDQTLNSFDFRNPTTAPGSNFPGFTAAAGYDLNHQAFPGITTDQLLNGASPSTYTVLPIGSYVAAEQPDFVLMHLGTNDLNGAINGGMDTAAEIAAWADETVGELSGVIDASIANHSNPSDLRILVANFIEYGFPFSSGVDILTAMEASSVYTGRIESMVAARNDSRLFLVDVATGFDVDTMTTDGVHPNAIGEQHIADAFVPALTSAGLCVTMPQLTNPIPGSVLSGETVTFNWASNGTPLQNYYLRAGTSEGASDIQDSGVIASNTLSETVSGLPVDGSTVYIEFSYKTPQGPWEIRDFQYTAANQGGGGTDGGATDGGATDGGTTDGGTTGGGSDMPELSNPVPGSVLSGETQTFNWVSNSTPLQSYYLRVGTSEGGNDILESGVLSSSTLSRTVSGLPVDGSTVYVEFSYKTPQGGWVIRDFQYTAATEGGGGTTGTTDGSTDGGATDGGATDGGATDGGTTDGGSTGGGSDMPELSNPVPGSVLSGETQTFNWVSNSTPLQSYYLRVGTSEGGNGILESGVMSSSTLSRTVSGLPVDGSTIYVEFSYKTPQGGWVIRDFQYTAATQGGGGTTGTTDGSTDGGTTDGTTDGGTTDGGTTGGTTGGGSSAPAITSPAPGSTLSGGTVSFAWAPNGTPLINYYLRVGTSAGGNQILESGTISASVTSRVVSGVPTDGSDVYVEFSYKTPQGPWVIDNYVYTAADQGGGSTGGGGTGGGEGDAPGFTTPAPGSTIAGTSVNFNWQTGGETITEWWVLARERGAEPYGQRYFNSQRITNAGQRSIVVTGLPADGSTVNLFLFFKINGEWQEQIVEYTSVPAGS